MMQVSHTRAEKRYGGVVLLVLATLAIALVGCGSSDDSFTPPPATIIRATEGDAPTQPPQAGPVTPTPAPKATQASQVQSQDSTYPRPDVVVITPQLTVPVYPSPQQ